MPDVVFADTHQIRTAPADQPDQPMDLVDQILAEGPAGMSTIARMCGTYRGGSVTHPSTPTRWHTKGVTLSDGRVVKLEAVRLNGRLVSSRAALLRFIRAQQEPQPATSPPVKPSNATAKIAAAAASAELDALGVR